MTTTLETTRRELLAGGCGLAVLLAVPLDADAGPLRATPAPRRTCPHTGCRHHRPEGICALSLHGEVIPIPEVP